MTAITATDQPADTLTHALEHWHGTLGGYTYHHCRCDECRSAWRAYRTQPHVRARNNATARARRGPELTLKRRAAKYGITTEKLTRLLDGSRCSICERTTIPGKGWHIDHDHACCETLPACGRCVRGILCHHCNVALGNLNDDPELLRKAAQYIEEHRA